jgi:hypothetical protein
MCCIHVAFCKKRKQDCTAERRKLERRETVHKHIMFLVFNSKGSEKNATGISTRLRKFTYVFLVTRQ